MACGCRKIGITLQVITFTANAILWIISVLAFTCGFLIGFSNETIQLDGDLLDIAVTTPATAFIIYGLLLTIVAIWGCFATLSAQLFLTIVYVILIGLYFTFDFFGGFLFLFKDDSIRDFYRRVNLSMKGYGDSNAKGIGIIPLSPTTYWEHLQKRGKCCGLESFEDWRNTPYSLKEKDIPDSCCNAQYEHRYCGKAVFKHPDRTGHVIAELLHPTGCLYIFPEAVRTTITDQINYIGTFTCCLLILCAVLTVVIIILVLTKKFRPEEGLDNPDFEEDLDEESNSIEDKEDANQPDDKNREKFRILPKPSFLSRYEKRGKVHPEYDESGDRRPHQNRRSSDKTKQKVLFRESGPQFIPRFEHSEPEEETGRLASGKKRPGSNEV